jgi:hypothetical protein
MSPIYANAVDSLRVGIEHSLKTPDNSSRKHAILSLAHAAELLLKEQLHRLKPALVYRYPDHPDKAKTGGITDTLRRLDQLGFELPPTTLSLIRSLQTRRDQIKHSYDLHPEDEALIKETLIFALEFMGTVLVVQIEQALPAEMLRQVQCQIFTRKERYQVAQRRLSQWMNSTWPTGDSGNFAGTYDCPTCRLDFLVIGHHERPFCFSCAASVEAAICRRCCQTYQQEKGCCREA